MIDRVIISQFTDIGALLIPLIEKRPREKNWSDELYDPNSVEGEQSAGWRIGPDWLVIDVDPRNGGDESFARLAETYFPDGLQPSVSTPSGGVHYYLHRPDGWQGKILKTSLEGYTGIDFLAGDGHQVVVPGSRVEAGSYRWLNSSALDDPAEAPIALMNILLNTRTLAVVRAKDEEQDDLMDAVEADQKRPEEQVREMLRLMDPDIEENSWHKVGMALKTWDETVGFKLWDLWSSKGSKYVPGDCRKRWRSWKGTGVTMGTLIYMAKEAGWIETFDDDTNTDLDASTDHWYDDIAYVDNTKRSWFSVETGLTLSTPAFDLQFGRHMEGGPRGGKPPKPSDWILQHVAIPVCHELMYLPQFAELRIVRVGDQAVFNSYRPGPKPAASVDEQAVKLFKRHLGLLVGEDNVDTLLCWVAHNIQKPGVKISWTPLIQGPQGIGKTSLGNILGAIMGRHNVSVISTTDVNSQFTGWAANSCIGIFEELRMTGHNRAEVPEKLKTHLTDPWVSITKKGVDPVQVPNPTNYIAFTNHKDAVRIDKDDRRWWIVFSPLDGRDDLPTDFGESIDYMRAHAAGLHRYLLDFDISDFQAFGIAPRTAHRQYVLEVEEERQIGASELLAVIEEDSHPGICEHFIHTQQAVEYLALEHSIEVTRNRVAYTINHLGFNHRVRCRDEKGRLHTLWAKDQTRSHSAQGLWRRRCRVCSDDE